MKHYDFTARFHDLYDLAVTLYGQGRRGAESFFNANQRAFLAANGVTPQHVYDYAEDQHDESEPGYDQALAIELVRRDYFLTAQRGVASSVVLNEPSLPAKTDSIRGIEWLPRLMPKARAKLRGELPASLMYCCGGDRRFFKTHDILPGEFLSVIWRYESNDAAVVEWVLNRGRAG